MIGAVDIGGTKIAAGIVNDAGKVLAKRETPTEKARSYRDGLSHIVRMLGEAAEQADTELSGIGIGSTGWVYPFTGEFGDVDFLPGWKGSNPVNDLAREFRGCWEALATGPALAAWFNAKAQAADPQARALTAKEIFQCARQGHPLACEAVARETYYLGLGLANLINLFVPERIVLGGSIMKSMRLEDLRKVIAQGCRFVPFEKTELALASLGDDANLIGAAQVWHHRFVPQAPAQGAA